MTTRKDFLAAGAIAASLVACSTTNGASQTPPEHFANDAAFNNILSNSAPHKHCFGIAGINGGEGLYAMNNLFGTYQHALDVPLDQVNLVGVVYRVETVTMAFNNDIWNTIVIPALPKLGNAIRTNIRSVQITNGNPFTYRPSNGNGEDASIESLVARGARFLVCGNATMQFAIAVGNATKKNPQDLYQTFAGGLLAGASLVPTGVWALHALQEHHFSYVQATI